MFLLFDFFQLSMMICFDFEFSEAGEDLTWYLNLQELPTTCHFFDMPYFEVEIEGPGITRHSPEFRA